MAWLTRDTERYDWALSTLQHPGLELERMRSQGDVFDMRALTMVMLVLLITVGAAFGAGVAAMLGVSMVALWLLVVCEVFMVVGVVILAVLGLKKLERRNAVVRTVQMRKEESR